MCTFLNIEDFRELIVPPTITNRNLEGSILKSLYKMEYTFGYVLNELTNKILLKLYTPLTQRSVL